MEDDIVNIFSFLENDEHYFRSTQDITYVYKYIVYRKGNISIVFKCELMDNSFDLEIHIREQNISYNINDRTRFSANELVNSEGTIIQNKDIFSYTFPVWSRATFQAKKEIINRKKRLGQTAQKRLREMLILYSELLHCALTEIEKQNR